MSCVKDRTQTLDPTRIPHHIAIIPDGNRRWAKSKELHPFAGHIRGTNVLIDIIQAGRELGIKVITFYLFSTENWTRSQEEISALMLLLQKFLKDNCELMQQCGIRLKTIGDIRVFSDDVIQTINETIEATSAGQSIDMVIALNYGSRNEILRAMHKMIDAYHATELSIEKINEETFASYLDTAEWKDPDLLIRTSGEKRISNYLLWQLSYAEIFFTEVMWPDFTRDHLLEAVIDYQKRERRWGGK